MKLQVVQVDVTAQLARQEAPTLILRRQRDAKRNATFLTATVVDGVWLLPSTPVEPGRPPQWSLCKSGEHVRVPLFPYLTQPQPELLIGMGIQLGVTAQAALPEPAEKLLLALGNLFTVTDAATQQARYQAWLGLAFRLPS